MAKPRIIIADTDTSYVIPLQLKVVEDFFEKVDLEIITDKEFFETLFSTPQRVDILIVSEDLYSQAMQRHNIAHTFVMNEQYEEDQTADLNVNHIFKYTSIKEIFNEIIGKSAGYKPASYTDKQGDVYTLPFRIFPTAQEEYIEIDIYREHEIIYTITQDNNFKKLHAPAGKQTDINIDFHYTPPLITMDVLPWANIHQDTEL